MTAPTTISNLLVWTGLWGASLAWAVNMQLGQILPYTDCRGQTDASAIASFGAVAIAVLSGLISLWQERRMRAAGSAGNTQAFGAAVSALAALLFAFALIMQGVASVVLTGCER